MLKTILFLIAGLLIVPLIAFKADFAISGQQMNVIWELGAIYLGVSLLCFVVSELTGNCSQVDKLWSIMPLVYAWVVAYKSGYDPRIVMMAVLVSIWGIRLSYNFGRRGGYTWIPWGGEEDYRWQVLRDNPMFKGKRFRWALFNLFFISLYQQGLILLFTMPIVVAWTSQKSTLGISDYLLSGVFILLVVMETVADQQQYNFQTEKYRRKNAGEDLGEVYGQGFCTQGLWGKMRHPNYAAEQTIWICFYFIAAAATDRWLNWSVAGAILLLLLFKGSSDFSEEISAKKYPAYTAYQKRVGRFLPKIIKWKRKE